MVSDQTPRRLLAGLLLIILALSAFPLPVVEAATTDLMGSDLPSPRDSAAAVGIDDSVYLFGGDLGSSRTAQILRYQPGFDTLSVASAALPSPRSAASAVTDGQYAYIFGGWGDSVLSQIVRYDPATDSVSVMGASLPSARFGTSAVFDGQYAYIFGGSVGGSTTDQIVRYDPATDTVSVMAATLPSARYATSAVFDGQYAYIFGGFSTATATKHDQIVRYDPSTDTTSLLPVSLPAPRYHTSAVHVDGIAHIFGGYDCSGACDTIFDVDLAGGTVSTNTTTLSSARALTSAAVVGRYAYILGGSDGTRNDDILRFGPLAPNMAPVVAAVADATVQATDSLTVSVGASDADHDALVLDLTPLPSGSTFTDNGDGTGTFDWTPARGQAGLYTLTLTADDGSATDSVSFGVNVTSPPDTPPVLDPIANVSAVADDLLTVAVAATDPDGDAITLALAAPAPAGASLADDGDGTGTISWTPTQSQEGNHTLTVEATSNGTTVLTSFNVTVLLPDNRAPVIAPLADLEAFHDDVLSIEVLATDADGDPLTLALTPLPGGASFDDVGNGTGYLNWTVASGSDGVNTFTVTASDGTNTTEASFNVTVYSGKEPQFDAVLDLEAAEGDLIDLWIRAVDPQDLNLTLLIEPQPLPFGASFTDAGNGSAQFLWDVSYAAAGIHAFSLTADNGEYATTTTFTVNVTNVDRAPVLDSSMADVLVALGDDLVLTHSAHDPDGSAVQLSASGVPSGATFTDNGDGTATLAWPAAGPVGSYGVTITATSNGDSVAATQTIDVRRDHDVALSTVTGSVFDIAPGETKEVQFRVGNTGVQDDTYSIVVSGGPGSGGYVLTQPANVSVTAGGSAIVTFEVTAPGASSGTRLSAVVQSGGDSGLSRSIGWIVRVPIVVEIVLADDEPALVGPDGVAPVAGEVRLSWSDGSPVVNQTFTARHAYLTTSATLETLSGQTNESGAWAFGGEAAPDFSLPGTHFLDASITRGARTDTGSASWTVAVADVPVP